MAFWIIDRWGRRFDRTGFVPRPEKSFRVLQDADHPSPPPSTRCLMTIVTQSGTKDADCGCRRVAHFAHPVTWQVWHAWLYVGRASESIVLSTTVQYYRRTASDFWAEITRGSASNAACIRFAYMQQDISCGLGDGRNGIRMYAILSYYQSNQRGIIEIDTVFLGGRPCLLTPLSAYSLMMLPGIMVTAHMPGYM
jgi:hypothetical protein